MDICFSCVIDAKPLFRAQSLNLLASIKAFMTPPYSLVFHCIGEHPESFLQMLSEQGVHIQKTTPFPGGHKARFCNKLRQLETERLLNADIAILCDTDIVFTENIIPPIRQDAIFAKQVDTATPPLPQLIALFKKAGIPIPKQFPLSTFSKAPVPPTYCNGGLYIAPGKLLRDVASLWTQRAALCLQELPEGMAHFSDQTGFMLAMAETGVALELLPEEWNYPMHFPPRQYKTPPQEPIKALHYHDKLNTGGYLTTIGVPFIDTAVNNANKAIGEFRRLAFNNETYWDFRYAVYPNIGSGLGSRGEHLQVKRQCVYPVISWFRNDAILDVGCGDLEVMREADATRYTGVDMSEEAVALCRAKRPDWQFHHGAIQDLPCDFALTLCMDVLIHQPTREAYDSLVNAIVDHSADTVLIGAYNEPPQHVSPVVFFYEPITQTLAQNPEIDSMEIIGRYRDITLVLARKRSQQANRAHPTDIQLGMLARYAVRSPFPELVKEMVSFSREKLGFFTKTGTRALEYPWFVSKAGAVSGKRMLDFGAGINPLPLWFAKNGADVLTVDIHPTTVPVSALSSCNEWGFFNYAQLDPRITSYNVAFASLGLHGLDILYSCSVIEHMPRQMRLENIAAWKKALAPDGKILLTVDLVPETRRLWNFSAGEVVELPGTHGTLEDLLDEIRFTGFAICDVSMEVACPGSRTDIAFIVAENTQTA